MLLSLFLSSTCLAQEYYYYGNGRRIPLNTSTEKIVVKFDLEFSQAEQLSFLGTNPNFLEWNLLYKDFYQIILADQPDITDFISTLRSQTIVDIANPVYILDENFEKMVTDEFVVQFKPNLPRKAIEAMNAKHHVEIVSDRELLHNLFILRITKESERSTLEMANLYYNDARTLYSLPNFIQEWKLWATPNDTYYSNQYYLHNTGQTGGTSDADIDAPEAWNITKGDSEIIIAVIDAGVQAHEDLPSSRLVDGYDFAGWETHPEPDPDSDPSPDGNEAHGMACAGIIAASWNNNKGIAGIAPNCKIMPIKICDFQGHFTENSELAKAINYAWKNSADVLSNSWGGRGGESEWDDNIAAAIDSALTFGRDPDGGGPLPAKGCVVVFAAGNTANRPSEYGYVVFPANVPGVLSVAATDKDNDIWYYSPRDNEVDIVSPSGDIMDADAFDDFVLQGDVWATDISGLRGYNDGNYGMDEDYNKYQNAGGDASGHYLARFGGTSAACPQAAGVAALILSENPNLTQSNVVNWIRMSADNVGLPANDQGKGRLNAYDALIVSDYLNEAPGIPQSFDVQKDGYHPKLTWTANTEPDVAGYKIERKEGSSGSWVTPTGANNILAHETSFKDWEIFILSENPSTVYYRMRAYDNEDYYSSYTPTKSINYNPFPKKLPNKDGENSIPTTYAMYQNYPNPFNPDCMIVFALPEDSEVILLIYNIHGQLVRTLANENFTAGYHSIQWDGKDEQGQLMSSGVYVYRIKAGKFIDTRKMIMME